LPDDGATLRRTIVELLATLQERQRENEALRHRLDGLVKRLYGPRGERYDPQQPWLFADLAGPPAGPAAAAPAAAADPPKRRARPHGRRRLPPHLPREVQHHVLSEAERVCAGCGQLRVDIGADRSEQLEYRPASLRVIEHLVHKYACPVCCPERCRQGPSPDQESQAMPSQPSPPEPTPPAPESAAPAAGPAAQVPAPPGQLAEPAPAVVAAAKPALPIAKGLPGPGLLAHLIVSKYVDHLPLHRLERIYERQGLLLRRSTLCDWLAACGQVLGPLYERLVAGALQSRALHTEETPVKLQDPVAHHLSTARFWVYLGDTAHPYNVFDFTVNRTRDGPQQFLASYQGYLHADAFRGYDGLYLPEAGTGTGRIIEVACNAHARRKFYEARGSDALRSHQALAYYRQLYELERSARDLDFSDTQKMQMRQDLAVPILETFQRWLEAQRPEVLPKSPLGEAVGYALHNWPALVRYTEAGFLAIDNNVAEREMKRIAIGRKHWLFVGSPQGGRTAAVLLSFTSTCYRLGVEPWAYLQDVLTRLPSLPAGHLDELLPDRWQAAQVAVAAPEAASAPSAASPPGAEP
jgi:transposase